MFDWRSLRWWGGFCDIDVAREMNMTLSVSPTKDSPIRKSIPYAPNYFHHARFPVGTSTERFLIARNVLLRRPRNHWHPGGH
jgi:hypothetical protein